MKLNIPDKYADLYLKTLTDRKTQLMAKIEEFNKEIEEIDHHISTLTSMPIFKEEVFTTPVRWETNGYQEEWSWTKKISFFFEKMNNIASAKQIVSFIMDQEKHADFNKVRSSISAALSNRLKSDDTIKFIDPITNTTFYGLPEWFDTKGQPKIDHLPQELKERIIN